MPLILLLHIELHFEVIGISRLVYKGALKAFVCCHGGINHPILIINTNIL